ncbi:MAG: hypothetical protein ACRBN8_00075 [Nannocystales bacterium]
MSDVPGIDPQMLERLRRGVPLVLSRTGRFRFDGADVTHARVESALRAGLDVTAEGEPIVHLGAQWCYVTVEDCPLRATAVSLCDSHVQLRLDDGRTLPLTAETLWEEPELGLRASVPAAHSGRPIAVRFTNAASMQLSEWIHFDEHDAAVLEVGGVRHTIGATSP